MYPIIRLFNNTSDEFNKFSPSFISTLCGTPTEPNGNVLSNSGKVDKKPVNDVIKIEPVNNGEEGNDVKTNVNNKSDSLVDYNDDEDDEKDEDDDYEVQTLFEKRATLVYNDPEPVSFFARTCPIKFFRCCNII